MKPDDARFRELLDRQEIIDCITRCARGTDRHDAELIRSCYHPNAVDDHGTFVGPANAFVDLVNGVNGVGGIHAKYFVGHQHYLLNHLVEIDGDVAHSETYFIFVAEQRGSGALSLSGGRYLDRWTRRAGRWAIQVRRVTLEWMTESPTATGPRADLIARFTQAQWDRSDVSYQRPLRARHPT